MDSAGDILNAANPVPHPSSLPSLTPLSKNAQKKLAKAAILTEKRKARRAYEKAKKKARRTKAVLEQSAAEGLDREDENADGSGGEDNEGEEEGEVNEGPKRKKPRLSHTNPVATSSETKRKKGGKNPFKARVVIDLGFDELMSENEIKSLTSQLAFTYSANRKSSSPFETVLFTSLNGRTFERLEGICEAAYKRWEGTEWWNHSYEKLWQSTQELKEENGEEVEEGECHVTKEVETKKKGKQPQRAPRESVVYLTADSDFELSELIQGETYIIGGICDHNRYKNLCLKKAHSTNIRSARLPIGTYLSQMKTRKVLTVNQTFEILLKWVGSRDWEKALFDVVPKRKFQEGAKSKGDHEDKKTEEVEAVTAVEKVIVDEEMLREATPDVKGKGSDNFEPLSATDVHVQDTPVTGTDPS